MMKIKCNKCQSDVPFAYCGIRPRENGMKIRLVYCNNEIIAIHFVCKCGEEGEILLR